MMQINSERDFNPTALLDAGREFVSFAAGSIAGGLTFWGGAALSTTLLVGMDFMATRRPSNALQSAVDKVAKDVAFACVTGLLGVAVAKGSWYVGREVYNKTNEALKDRDLK